MKKKLIASLIIGTFLISGLSFIGCDKSDNSKAQTNTTSDSNSKKDSTTTEDINTQQNKQESPKGSNKENKSLETDKKVNENNETSKPKKDIKQTNHSVVSKEKFNKKDNSSKKIDLTSNVENKTNKTSNNNSKEKNLKNEYEKADKELNDLWKVIVNYGADYPELIKSQKQWIKYKDSKDLATKTKLTQERINTLQKWFGYQRRIQGEKGYQFAQTHECPSLDWN